MIIKCEQCLKPFEATRTDSKYCSASCRKLAFQNRKLSVPNLSVPAKKELSVPDGIPEPKDMTREQLRHYIRCYKGTSWVGSPEFAELKRRLKTWSLEKLEKLNYWIPNWKRNLKKI